MLKELKERVCKCNAELLDNKLVVQTFGNVSGIDREKGVVAIKPSGVPFCELKADDIVLLDLDNNVIEGTLNPSSDAKTHIVLYKNYPKIGGVVHTHSTYATAWAQAKKAIPCFGTTHADYVQGEIPCTEDLSMKQIEGDYETETGNQIVKRLLRLRYEHVQMILVASHGPFTWGENPEQALGNSILLEEIARIALGTINIKPTTNPINEVLLNKHFNRKHGPNRYYGQKN